MTLDLPEHVVQRLTAEADRRGVALADLIADLAAQLPDSDQPRRRLAFVGSARPGQASPSGLTTSSPRASGGTERVLLVDTGVIVAAADAPTRITAHAPICYRTSTAR